MSKYKRIHTKQKAQRYDEALERARELYNNEECRVGMTPIDLEIIFPELKESEDESISKEIIYFLSRNTFQFGEDIDKYKSWIAWLEKQGQESKKVSIWKHWKTGIAGNAEDKQIYLIKIGDIYKLSSFLAVECDYIKLSELDNLMLEKQWKPSKEQMNALDSTLQYKQVSNISKEHLNSLYNDLKQL